MSTGRQTSSGSWFVETLSVGLDCKYPEGRESWQGVTQMTAFPGEQCGLSSSGHLSWSTRCKGSDF